MRHNKKFNHLSRTASHRQAMLGHRQHIRRYSDSDLSFLKNDEIFHIPHSFRLKAFLSGYGLSLIHI